MSTSIKFKSSRFGEIEVPEETLIVIPSGMIGFANYTKFVLLDYNPPFSWLHSVEAPDLAFVVVNAAEFGDSYAVPLPMGDSDIDLKEGDEVAIVTLVSVRPDPTQTTVNLKAPVVVNLRNRKGRQIVIDQADYPTRMPLWANKDEGKQGESEKK